MVALCFQQVTDELHLNFNCSLTNDSDQNEWCSKKWFVRIKFKTFQCVKQRVSLKAKTKSFMDLILNKSKNEHKDRNIFDVKCTHFTRQQIEQHQIY